MSRLSFITIQVAYSTITEKVKIHLALIGKRAKDVNGNSLFSELTTSAAEDQKVWVDLANMGAETLVSSIAPITGSYATTTTNVTFKLMSTRWKLEGGEDEHDITVALGQSCEKFLWLFVLYQYLSIIRPSSEYAKAYNESCEQQLMVIRNMAFVKRDPDIEKTKYSSITGEVINED